jgi:predicted O-methyltransferase YrrM
MDADAVLGEIEAEAAKNHWPIIGPERGRSLDEVVSKYAPGRVLEVGTLVGYSAIRMARKMPTGGKILCLEIDPARARTARFNAERAGLADRIDVRVGDAAQAISSLPGAFDLVFLDADKQQYLTYLMQAEPKLSPRGVVVADNVQGFPRELHDFLEYMNGSGHFARAETYVAPSFPGGPTDSVEVFVRKQP